MCARESGVTLERDFILNVNGFGRARRQRAGSGVMPSCPHADAAAPAPAPQQDFSKVEIKTTKLADGFFTLEGSGGTIGILAGPGGVR